jgi:hypothetical protein
MSARVPTPIDDLLDALEERMGIEHVTSGDASPSQRSRVVWSRAGAIVPGAAPWRRAGRKIIGRDAHPWKATIYAATDLEVSELLEQLRGHIDILQGPPQGGPALGTVGDDDYVAERPGYEFKPGTIEPRGGDGVATQYACDAQVTFYRLVASHIHPPATVTSVTVSTASGEDDGPGWTDVVTPP